MVLHLRGGEMTSVAARFDHSWPTITPPVSRVPQWRHRTDHGGAALARGRGL